MEILPDEQKANKGCYLALALGWFSAQGIHYGRVLSDTDSYHRFGETRKAFNVLDLKSIRTKLYHNQDE
jgi:hypothetical protein